MSRKVRVLVVDDSALVRKALTRALTCDDIEVVGQAGDAWAARDQLMRCNPDVVTLDVEMPRMDGVTFLRKIMHYRPMPVIIISTLTGARTAVTLEALAAGAFDAIEKPSSPESLAALPTKLREVVRAAAESRVKPAPGTATGHSHDAHLKDDAPRPELIAIGASTGGTVAFERIVLAVQGGESMPPMVVCQHMPSGFTKAYAERLDKLSSLAVREAVDGEPLRPGSVLIAPGGKHLRVVRGREGLAAQVSEGPLVNGHAPSVDVLFGSIAEVVGPRVFAALLTGMGRDGAQGLLQIRSRGGMTVAQDEASCVVYGMPKAAVELNAAVTVWPIDRIGSRVRMFGERRALAKA